MTPRIDHLRAWRSIANGVKRTCRHGWAMAGFEYRQAEEVRDAFRRHGVRYLFLGKSAAILLGFPDTTQDVDIFPERSKKNGQTLVAALRDLGFELTAEQISDIDRGKDFV